MHRSEPWTVQCTRGTRGGDPSHAALLTGGNADFWRAAFPSLSAVVTMATWQGVAALYVRKGTPFARLLHGGGQENVSHVWIRAV
jgi:anti-sigma-K factor RskA